MNLKAIAINAAAAVAVIVALKKFSPATATKLGL